MAGTLTVDTIQSDSSYASRINVTSNVAFTASANFNSNVAFTSPVNFTGGVQVGGQDATFGGMRNRIINGAMVIDQRFAGANTTPSTTGALVYITDRFSALNSGASKLKYGQNLNSITPPSGFINYLGAQTVSANTVSTGDYFQLIHRIEGYNCSDFDYGLSTAKTTTLSFWVNSSIIGEHSGSITNNNAGSSWRAYVFTFTINQANTWEYKTITIPGDTSGTWFKTNDAGLEVRWSLGIGTTYQKAAGSWGTGIHAATTGGAKVVETLNATFYITGVQLEKGSTASSFEYRAYTTELQLCQRYYWTGNSSMYGYYGFGGNVPEGNYIAFPVPMRIAPTITFGAVLSAGGTNADYSVFIGVNGYSYYVNVTATTTAYRQTVTYATSEL
jgi:hypothetical protein